MRAVGLHGVADLNDACARMVGVGKERGGETHSAGYLSEPEVGLELVELPLVWDRLSVRCLMRAAIAALTATRVEKIEGADAREDRLPVADMVVNLARAFGAIGRPAHDGGGGLLLRKDRPDHLKRGMEVPLRRHHPGLEEGAANTLRHRVVPPMLLVAEAVGLTLKELESLAPSLRGAQVDDARVVD